MDGNAFEEIRKLIYKNIEEISKSQGFISAITSEKVRDGDFIQINNSFIIRKPVKTNKNSQVLTIKIENGKPDYSGIYVSTTSNFNKDFKKIDSSQTKKMSMEAIDLAIAREVKHLGRLLFFLIGEIVDCVHYVEIQNRLIGKLKFDPLASKTGLVEEDSKKCIVVNQLTDPGAAWSTVKEELSKIQNTDLDALEKVFGQSFLKLQNDSKMIMNFPTSGSERYSNSFIEKMLESITEQRKKYKSALDKCLATQDPENVYLQDIMRISYVFADDAMRLLQLLVSLADLKPIVMWTTLMPHYSLAESIRNLPWTKSDLKAPTENYVEKINGARNHAFHNLFFFDRTIEADLSGIQINAKKLTILPLHSAKNSIPLDYEDRELIEILKGFTRAMETVVSLDFWEKNLSVMESFETLLKSTENTLWLLNNAT